MKLLINGRPRELQATSLRELLRELGYDPEQHGIAVARNDRVVRRGDWAAQAVREGDRIEIVGAVQGG